MVCAHACLCSCMLCCTAQSVAITCSAYRPLSELAYIQVQELISTVSEETAVAEVHLKVRSAACLSLIHI